MRAGVFQVIVALLAVLLLLPPSVAAQPALPTVVEIPTAAGSHAWLSTSPLPSGYVEQEFEMSGTAGLYTYGTSPPPPWTVTLSQTQAYVTRFIVRRPADAARFNGTVIVEWLNVTAGYDADIEWTKVSEYLVRSGYAYVGLSAQAAGVNALKKWDAQRYERLNIADDGLSYDIFTQTGSAVRQMSTLLLGGLPVQQVLGTGVSQSAWRLVVYANAFQPMAHAYDGFLLHSRGRGSPPLQGVGVMATQRPDPLRTDLDVPVLVLQTEGDLLAMDYAVARQPDTDRIRTWEVAGAPHVGAGTPYDNAVAAGVRARDTAGAAPAPNPSCLPNPFPIWPVANAAWDHLRTWVGGGNAPPMSGLIQLSRQATLAPIPPGDGNGLIARDELGNALGGIRTPAIDAPLATYYGSSPCNSGALGFLAGQVVSFDGPTLVRLYPTHDDYVAKVTASVEQAVADGFILPEDGARVIADAKSSTIPNLAVAQPAPPTVQMRTVGTLGTILIDRQGFALYTFDRDTPGSSSCTGDCATTWAPALLETGDPVAPQDLPGRLTVNTRPDGGRQVTYDDRPLYRYTGDLVNSDTNGTAIAGWRLAETGASPP